MTHRLGLKTDPFQGASVARAAAGRRVSHLVDIQGLQTEPVRRAAAYWLTKVRPDRVPSRADIRPEELVGELPYLYLIDVCHEPLNFRVRLVGTAICDWAGRDFTGVAINATEHGPFWEPIYNDYRWVMENRTATCATREGHGMVKDFYLYERFLAPLASDGSTVDMIFGALHVIERPRGGEDWLSPGKEADARRFR